MHRTSVGSDGPERLGAIEYFSGLSEAHRRALARLADELTADPGDVLMDEGEYGYEAIFIEDGTAEVRQQGELINTVGAGRSSASSRSRTPTGAAPRASRSARRCERSA